MMSWSGMSSKILFRTSSAGSSPNYDLSALREYRSHSEQNTHVPPSRPSAAAWTSSCYPGVETQSNRQGQSARHGFLNDGARAGRSAIPRPPSWALRSTDTTNSRLETP